MKTSARLAVIVGLKRLGAMVFSAVCGWIIWLLILDLSIRDLRFAVAAGGALVVWFALDKRIGDGGFWETWWKERD